MNRSGLWAGASGLVFVVLYVVGLIVLGDLPRGGDTDEQILSHYDDDGNVLRIIIGSHIVVLGLGFLLWFFASLRTTIFLAEGEPGRLAALALAGGAIVVTVMAVGAVALTTIATGKDFADAPPDPDAARFLPRLGDDLMAFAGSFFAIVPVIATAVATLRTDVFPRWVAWFSYLMVPALFASAALALPQVALLLWIAVVSVLLARGDQRSVPVQSTPSS